MKQFSLFVVASAIGLSVSGQQLQQKVLTEPGYFHCLEPQAKNPGLRKSAILWEEQFDGSFNTPNGQWTFSSAQPYHYWEWSLSGQRWFESGFDFVSPSSGNGFARLDIAFTSDSAGIDLNGNTPVSVTLSSPVIDLSASPRVRLKLVQSVAHCCSNAFDAFLDVSTDGGATYNLNNSFNLTSDLDPNFWSGNEEVSLVLTNAIQADPSQVVLRFRWESNDVNRSSNAYWWLIDDLVLEENPDYEFEVFTPYYGDLIQQFDYRQVPRSQVVDYLLGARVRNNGEQDEAGTRLVATITDENGAVQTYRSEPFYFSAGLDTNVFFPTFTAPEPGLYTISYSFDSPSLPMDPVTENNTGSTSLRVTTGVFSHDRGDWQRDGGGVVEHYRNGPAYVPYSIGLYYNAYSNDEVISLQSIFPNTENVRITEGQQIIVDLFKMNLPLVHGSYESGTTVLLDVTSAEITDLTDEARLVNVLLPAPFPFEEGNIYQVLISVNGDQELLNIAESGESRDNSAMVKGNLGSAGDTWYRTTDAPVMRLVLANRIGVEEGEQQGFWLFQNAPNPFRENTTIRFELSYPSNVGFSVTDITGRVVFNEMRENLAPGSYSIDLERKDFNAGVYFYSLSVNGKTTTRNMVVTE